MVLESVSSPPCCPLSPSPLWLLQGHTPWPGPRNQGVRTRLRGRKRGTREGRKDITKEREKQSWPNTKVLSGSTYINRRVYGMFLKGFYRKNGTKPGISKSAWACLSWFYYDLILVLSFGFMLQQNQYFLSSILKGAVCRILTVFFEIIPVYWSISIFYQLMFSHLNTIRELYLTFYAEYHMELTRDPLTNSLLQITDSPQGELFSCCQTSTTSMSTCW